MSEWGVGLVEREALAAARAEEIAGNQAYYRRLERIAEMDRLGLAQVTGDRSTERLLQENWRGAKGLQGSSLNMYVPSTKRWHQTWMR